MTETQTIIKCKGFSGWKKKKKNLSLAEIAMTLNTASEIFDLYFPQKLKISDRQGSEPAVGL